MEEKQEELKSGDLVEVTVIGVIEEPYHDTGYLVNIHGTMVPVLKSALQRRVELRSTNAYLDALKQANQPLEPT